MNMIFITNIQGGKLQEGHQDGRTHNQLAKAKEVLSALEQELLLLV